MASKKIDNRAAVRNRLKRQVREIFRTEKARWARPPSGGAVDVVVTLRPEARGSTFSALRIDALKTLEQALQRLSTAKAAPPANRR